MPPKQDPRLPNKVLAPVVIAGITAGFLGAAYRFIFKSSTRAVSVTKPDVPSSRLDEIAALQAKKDFPGQH